MKRAFSNLAGALSVAALLATLIGVGVPEAALGEAASRPASVPRPLRRVHVRRVWCEPGMESDPETGMAICAHVEALGLKWLSLDVEVRLRTPDGKPVRVAAGAPEGYADEKGRFWMSARAPIFDDPFEWKELRASFPHQRVLDLPADRPQRVIATFRVSSSGLSSLSEAEITVPPAPAPGVRRAVRVLAIDPLPNAVEGYVEAVGLDRSKMVGRLSLRQEGGRPLVWKDPKTGTQRPFENRAELDVISDQAQIFLHSVGYRGLGLEPGRHRLILAYSASCQGLTATIEEEHVISVHE